MELNYTKSEVELGRKFPSLNGRRLAEDWLKLMAEVERLQVIVDPEQVHPFLYLLLPNDLRGFHHTIELEFLEI